jgi:CRP-like cAMP-binding protein
MENFNLFIESIRDIVPLNDAEVETLASVAKFKEYKKDDYLTREGETENYIYFILDGAIRNYCLNRGEEFSLDFFFSGSFTNSFMSFLLREKSIVNVQALVETKVIRIHYDEVTKLYAQSLNFNKLGRIVTESLYVKRTRRELSFITQTAKERYETLLSGNQELINRLPQKYLASFLGIKAESLSRIRKPPKKRRRVN